MTKEVLRRLWQGQDGQDLTEYGLLLVLIALAAISATAYLSNILVAAFQTVAWNLASGG